MKEKVVVFDLDGTLTRLPMIYLLTEKLISGRVFSARAREIYRQSEAHWNGCNAGFDDFIADLISGFTSQLRGVSKPVVVQVARELVFGDSIRYYKYTLSLLKRAQEMGYFSILLSHSPDFLIDLFGEKLEFDFTKGTFYPVDKDDFFLGSYEKGGRGYDKKEALLDIFEELSGLESPPISPRDQLEKLVIVGDSAADIPMLELATAAICFRPSADLLMFVSEEKREQRRFRVVEYKTVVEIDGAPVEDLEHHLKTILS